MFVKSLGAMEIPWMTGRGSSLGTRTWQAFWYAEGRTASLFWKNGEWGSSLCINAALISARENVLAPWLFRQRRSGWECWIGRRCFGEKWRFNVVQSPCHGILVDNVCVLKWSSFTWSVWKNKINWGLRGNWAYFPPGKSALGASEQVQVSHWLNINRLGDVRNVSFSLSWLAVC